LGAEGISGKELIKRRLKEEPMATVVVMPKLGPKMIEGAIEKWLKGEGDKVEKEEPLVSILVEKVSFEYGSPTAGVLRKIIRAADQVVSVNEPIAIIGTVEEDISNLDPGRLSAGEGRVQISAEKRPTSLPSEEKRIHASPLAKKIAAEKGVDLAHIVGTGPRGRITQEDVLKIIEEKGKRSVTAEVSPSEIIPVSGIRRTIGLHMSESKKNIPHFYLSIEVEMTNLLEARKQLLESIEKEKGMRVSLTDFLVKITANAIKKHMIVNSTFEEGQIRIYKEINVGVAMGGREGLIVPVVRRANERSIGEICLRTKELNKKVKDGTLSLDDVTGGTFTISNLGMYGIDVFTAIINPPQCAILTVGKVSHRPIAANNEVAVRPMIWMTLSVDHRVLDGKQAADFLGEIKRQVENPLVLFT